MLLLTATLSVAGAEGPTVTMDLAPAMAPASILLNGQGELVLCSAPGVSAETISGHLERAGSHINYERNGEALQELDAAMQWIKG